MNIQWSEVPISPIYKAEKVALRATAPTRSVYSQVFKLYLELSAIEGVRRETRRRYICELQPREWTAKAQAESYIKALRPIIELRLGVCIHEVHWWGHKKLSIGGER